MYTPYDINEAIAHRKDYVEEGLRSGSPVVGICCRHGLLLLTVRRSQRKIYEIYDRQMFAAIGKQSDIENVRLAAIQQAHQEGFERSPDDVTLQRLVGFGLSPTLKKAFGDQMYVPVVIRALFAEMGRTPSRDGFYTLNYDGEFRHFTGCAVISGTQVSEDKMMEVLGETDKNISIEDAMWNALTAWAAGARELLTGRRDEEDDLHSPLRVSDENAEIIFLKDELKTGALEVGLLERRANAEVRFRLFSEIELKPLLLKLD